MAGISMYKEFSKPALRGLVEELERERLESPDFTDKFLPDDQVYSNTFAYDVVRKSNNVAAMIGVGAEPPVMDRDEVASRMGELAKFGNKYIATEEELLQLNQPRNNQEEQALIDNLLVKGGDLVTSVQNRVDHLKAEAITTGKIDYDQNGVKVKLDFTKDMPDEHKVELTGDDTWDNEDHDVIGDLLEWVEEYEDNSGKKPDVILMSRETQALLLKNTTIVTEAAGIKEHGRERVSIEQLNNVLSGYDLPPVQVISRRKFKYKNQYDGEQKKIEFFPKHRLIMASEGLGNFLFGPTAENEFQPGIVLDTYDKQEPIQSIMRVAAAGVPVIEQPDLLFHADVVEEG